MPTWLIGRLYNLVGLLLAWRPTTDCWHGINENTTLHLSLPLATLKGDRSSVPRDYQACSLILGVGKGKGWKGK